MLPWNLPFIFCAMPILDTNIRHLTYRLLNCVFGIMAIVQFLVQTHVCILLLPEECQRRAKQAQRLRFHVRHAHSLPALSASTTCHGRTDRQAGAVGCHPLSLSVLSLSKDVVGEYREKTQLPRKAMTWLLGHMRCLSFIAFFVHSKIPVWMVNRPPGAVCAPTSSTPGSCWIPPTTGAPGFRAQGPCKLCMQLGTCNLHLSPQLRCALQYSIRLRLKNPSQR